MVKEGKARAVEGKAGKAGKARVVEGKAGKARAFESKAGKARAVASSSTGKAGKSKAVSDPQSTARSLARLRKKANKSNIARQKFYVRKNWAKRLVWTGKKGKTSGGLKKHELMKAKSGKIVSKRKSKHGTTIFRQNHCDLWHQSLMRQRAEKGIKGFVCPKKNGDRQQRRLWQDTYQDWMDSVAMRIVQVMQTQPDLMGKIHDQLGSKHRLVPSEVLAAAMRASQDVAVKSEEGEF